MKVLKRLRCLLYGHRTTRRLYDGEIERCLWCGAEVLGRGARP